ncbi:GTP-binding protein [Streptomyces zagrosensis]|uniref:Ribosomal protection tetracycline resistance protein n=1 Tax=Streptomyces zagrosensis TaxID=1042984 RepID=A0A7W9QBU9_9ACTN|nr:GTP-binding protein [Streptomyces zagrosensis]MBB5936357.1 ribosomal protection tetracycline resistance protein [Streptomyces zagrosensis]
MTTLNIGILAHVDAGKTSLTERLLFDAGSTERLGSVDAGDTQTDTDAIERQRGITVRTAVAPFMAGGLQVNVIDTPGHPDFIAEVERALSVLDAAVLVLSAVEGVQPQARVLMKTLRALRLPTLLFVNKIDRSGARESELLADIRRKLSPHTVAVNEVRNVGTPSARVRPRSLTSPAIAAHLTEVLAEQDEALLAQWVEGGRTPSPEALRSALAAQTAAGLLHPLYFGSALTGQGADALVEGICRLLPAPHGPRSRNEMRGTVFAIERDSGGAKVCYVRMRAGTLRRGQQVALYRAAPDGVVAEQPGRITALEVVRPERVPAAPDAPDVPDRSGASDASGELAIVEEPIVTGERLAGGRDASAGQFRARDMAGGDIARVWGLAQARVGDRVGRPAASGEQAALVPDLPRFPPPGLESVVVPRDPGRGPQLHAALTTLADQDPLIGARTAPGRGTTVLLYGEVQKEVIAATLHRDFGIDADFEPSRVRCVERPVGRAEAYEGMDEPGGHLFWASIGLRVEPGAPGSGVGYRLGVELGSLPLAFHRAIEVSVREALEQGLYGWPVTDCVVTLYRSGFSSVMSTAADFRKLTSLVLLPALAGAGCQVYEPYHAFELEVPPVVLSAVLGVLSGLGAEVTESAPSGAPTSGAGAGTGSQSVDAGQWCVRGALPARQVSAIQRRLPGLTGGEGVWWSRPSGDRAVTGVIPRRERTDGNPLDRAEYLRHLSLRER